MDQTKKATPKVLVTQAYTPALASSYERIIERYGVEIDFHPFIKNDPIAVPLFRTYKEDILGSDVFVFTSKASLDHFFQLVRDCDIKLPITKKYICINESLQNKLRKYIVFRKRQVFAGKKNIADLYPLLHKHRKEKFLLPCSNAKKTNVSNFLKEKGCMYKEIVIYNTGPKKVENLNIRNYDVVVFFSPVTVEAFARNFPNYEQGDTKIITFNPITAAAIEDQGWKNTIHASQEKAPSIVDALDYYFRHVVPV